MSTYAERLVAALEDEDHDARYRLILIHGRDYAPAPLPVGIEVGKEKCCFANAYGLATSRPGEFTYIEGYATTIDSAKWPKRHAWCIDGDGRVVDPTWTGLRTTSPAAYRGLALPLDIVAPFADEYSRGTLDGMSDRINEIADALGLDWV